MNIIDCGNGKYISTIEPRDTVEEISAYSHLNVFELIAAIEGVIKRQEQRIKEEERQ